MAKFKVKKNKYFFFGPRWNFFGRNKKEFNVKAFFCEDCVYKLAKNHDQINKLTGWSYHLIPFYNERAKAWRPGHQLNSVRFGWRSVDGEEIEIIAYAYIDGVRKEKLMLSISTGEWIHLNFKEEENDYVFKAIAENGEISIVRFRKTSIKKGFLGLFIHRLYPYFGGKIAAPHKMTIILKYFKN